MHRSASLPLALSLLLAACAPAPDLLTVGTVGAEPTRLAACLAGGGELLLQHATELDVTYITALDVADDGTVLLGESLGAVNVAPDFLERAPSEVELHTVLPAGGPPVSAVAMSTDQAALASADHRGRVGLTERDSNGPLVWEQVRDAPLRDVAAAADDRIAWIDADHSGTPTLWHPGSMSEPVEVPTTLWNAWTTSFFADDTRWLVAGDWYGLPQLEVHDLDDLGAEPATWLDESRVVGSGTTTIAAVRADGAFVLAGPRAFEESGLATDGFLAVVDADLDTAQVTRLPEHRPRHGVLLPGGEVLVTVGEEGMLVAWDVASATRLADLPVDDYAHITETDGLGAAELAAPLAAHPDGEHLLVGGRHWMSAIGCE